MASTTPTVDCQQLLYGDSIGLTPLTPSGANKDGGHEYADY